MNKTLPQILIHMESFMKAMNNKIGVIKNKKLSIIYKFYNIINCKIQLFSFDNITIVNIKKNYKFINF